MAASDFEVLRISVVALADAASRASTALGDSGLANDDMPMIAQQVERALATVDELHALLAGGDRDTVFVSLHRLNNQLTGVLSLTMLIKDELEKGLAPFLAFERLDAAGRRTAATVRQLASGLRQEMA